MLRETESFTAAMKTLATKVNSVRLIAKRQWVYVNNLNVRPAATMGYRAIDRF